MRHPILSRVPLVFLGTCFRWAVTHKLSLDFTFPHWMFLWSAITNYVTKEKAVT